MSSWAIIPGNSSLQLIRTNGVRKEIQFRNASEVASTPWRRKNKVKYAPNSFSLLYIWWTRLITNYVIVTALGFYTCSSMLIACTLREMKFITLLRPFTPHVCGENTAKYFMSIMDYFILSDTCIAYSGNTIALEFQNECLICIF